MMKNRVVLVTGASRGIGAATARLLSRNGAAVAVNYHRSEAEALALVEELRRGDRRAVAVRADVRDPAQVERMKEAMAKATPLGRNARPEDVAGAVLAVAADTGRFLTGVYVPVSGGGLML